MSADLHPELVNILSPDLYLKSVPPELQDFRVRVFQEQNKYVTLSLDSKSKALASLDNVPIKHIDIVTRAIFLGLEEGIKTYLQNVFTK